MVEQNTLTGRRRFLRAGLALTGVASAGCLRLEGDGDISGESAGGKAPEETTEAEPTTDHDGPYETVPDELSLETAWTVSEDPDGVGVHEVVYAGFDGDGRDQSVTALSPETGDRLWETTVPRQFSLAFDGSPDRLFMTGYTDEDDMDRGGSIRAFDRAGGGQTWEFTGSRHWFDYPTVGEDCVFCTATARDDSGQGTVLYAFDKETGTEQWAAEVGDSVPSGLAVLDGTVILSLNGIKGFDASTGEKLPNLTESLPAPYQVTADVDRIYIRTHFELRAYYRSNFRQAWAIDLEDPTQFSRPVVAGQTLLTAQPEGIVAVDAQTGEHQWELATIGRALTPRVEEGVIWLADSIGVIYALRHSTGDVLFKSEPAADRGPRHVFPLGRRLIVNDWETVTGYRVRSS